MRQALTSASGFVLQYLSYAPAFFLNILFLALTAVLLWLALPGLSRASRSRLEALTIASLVSMFYVGTIALVLAMAAAFSLPLFFAIWSAGLVLLMALAWRKGRLRSAIAAWNLMGPFPVWFWLLVLLWLVLYGRPFETVVGGRDPGVYVNMAAGVAENGRIGTADPFFASLPASVQREFVWCPWCPPGVIPSRFPGYLWIGGPNGSLGDNPGLVLPQFMPFYPAFMAPGYALAGYNGALTVLPIGMLIFALVLTCLVRLLTSNGSKLVDPEPLVTGLPAFLLLLCPATFWYGRMANADLFLGLFMFAGAYFWARSAKEAAQSAQDTEQSSNVYWLLAVASSGAALLTKIDIWLLLPAVVVALQIYHPKLRGLLRWAQRLLWAGICLVYLALVEWFVYPYVLSTLRGDAGIWIVEHGQVPVLVAAGILFLITIGASIGPFLAPARLSAWQARSRFSPGSGRLIIPCVLFGLPVLAGIVVPRFGVSSQAFSTLMAYVSLPLLLFALVGLISLFVPRLRWEGIPVLVAAIGNFLYTSRLLVSQNLPWDLRRTTSTVFPALLLLASMGIFLVIQWLLSRSWRPASLSKWACGALLVALFVPLVIGDVPFYIHDELKGAREQIGRFRSMFPPNAVVLSDGTQAARYFAPAVSAGGQRDVLEYFTSDDFPNFDASAIDVVAQKAEAAGRPFFFVSQDDVPPPTDKWQFEEYWRDTWLVKEMRGSGGPGQLQVDKTQIYYRIYRSLGSIVNGQRPDPRLAVYEAESLPSTVGGLVADPAADNGWAKMAGPARFGPGRPGALVYGPYAELPSGSYLARFRVRAKNLSPAAVDEVRVLGPDPEVPNAPKTIAAQSIATEKPGYTFLELPFKLTQPTRLEYSLQYGGRSQVWIDRVEVVRVDG